MNPEYSYVAHAGFLLLALSYLIRDVLYLRAIAVTAACIMITFNVLTYDQPAWVVIWWNIMFITINICHIAWLLHDRRQGSLNEREERLRSTVFASLAPPGFRKLMAVAQWRDVTAGEVLIRQGDDSSRPLIYLYSGFALVAVDSRNVARIGQGSFVGEMGYLTDAAATATVSTAGDCCVVSWPADELGALLRREPQLRQALHQILAHDVVEKLALQVRQPG